MRKILSVVFTALLIASCTTTPVYEKMIEDTDAYIEFHLVDARYQDIPYITNEIFLEKSGFPKILKCHKRKLYPSFYDERPGYWRALPRIGKTGVNKENPLRTTANITADVKTYVYMSPSTHRSRCPMAYSFIPRAGEKYSASIFANSRQCRLELRDNNGQEVETQWVNHCNNM